MAIASNASKLFPKRLISHRGRSLLCLILLTSVLAVDLAVDVADRKSLAAVHLRFHSMQAK